MSNIIKVETRDFNSKLYYSSEGPMPGTSIKARGDRVKVNGNKDLTTLFQEWSWYQQGGRSKKE